MSTFSPRNKSCIESALLVITSSHKNIHLNHKGGGGVKAKQIITVLFECENVDNIGCPRNIFVELQFWYGMKGFSIYDMWAKGCLHADQL